MPWTQADIDAAKAAYASGAKEIRTADGRDITYRDTDDFLQLLAQMENDVAVATGQLPNRFVLVGHRSGVV